jgi:hypothetical protein
MLRELDRNDVVAHGDQTQTDRRLHRIQMGHVAYVSPPGRAAHDQYVAAREYLHAARPQIAPLHVQLDLTRDRRDGLLEFDDTLELTARQSAESAGLRFVEAKLDLRIGFAQRLRQIQFDAQSARGRRVKTGGGRQVEPDGHRRKPRVVRMRSIPWQDRTP